MWWHARMPTQVVVVRNEDHAQESVRNPRQIAATLKAFVAPDNLRTEDRDVTLSLETLADLDERQQVGRDKRSRHKPLGRLMHSGYYDKLSHAEELARAVAADTQ
jgi:hypothetical protein